MVNRISSAIERIEAKLKNLDKAKLATLEATNKTLDASEHFGYQEAQARAHAMGILTTVEAQILYQTISNWSIWRY